MRAAQAIAEAAEAHAAELEEQAQAQAQTEVSKAAARISSAEVVADTATRRAGAAEQQLEAVSAELAELRQRQQSFLAEQAADAEQRQQHDVGSDADKAKELGAWKERAAAAERQLATQVLLRRPSIP
jgi:hypothetical protein